MEVKQKKPLNIKLILVIGIAVIAIILSGFIGSRLPVFGSKTKIEADTIKESIKTIAELATLSYSYTDVGLFSDKKTVTLFGNEIGIIGTDKSFIISYDGEVKMGLDVSQISVEVKDKRIIITMPPIKILSHVVNEKSVKLLDEKSGLFNSISVKDYTNFIAEQKQKMDEKVHENGLFSQAQTNAEAQIKALLLAIPGISEEYKVEFVY